MREENSKNLQHILHPAVRVEASREVIEILSGVIFQHSSTGIEELENGFLAYFPAGTAMEDLEGVIAEMAGALKRSGMETGFQAEVEMVPEYDWVSELRKRFRPFRVGEGMIVRPPWEPPVDGLLNLLIEPSMAFGTGEHPTTRLCLEEIERVSRNGNAGSLLDVGTGSGILAIAARKLGFSPVSGIDNDPVAVEIASDNCRRNGVEDVIIQRAVPREIRQQYDVVVANLTSRIIMDVMNDLLRFTGKKGEIILSGILEDQGEEKMRHLERLGLKVLRNVSLEGWVMLHLGRN
jgi:ribosomal protein L11 methyltransferase